MLSLKSGKLPAGTIILAIVLVLRLVSCVTGDINISNEASASNIETPLFMTQFYYSDIVSIEFKENLEFEKNGFSFPYAKVWAGNFKNDSLGEVVLFAYKDNPSFIVITLSDRIIVVNQANKELTQATYEEYLTKIE